MTLRTSLCFEQGPLALGSAAMNRVRVSKTLTKSPRFDGKRQADQQAENDSAQDVMLRQALRWPGRCGKK